MNYYKLHGKEEWEEWRELRDLLSLPLYTNYIRLIGATFPDYTVEPTLVQETPTSQRGWFLAPLTELGVLKGIKSIAQLDIGVENTTPTKILTDLPPLFWLTCTPFLSIVYGTFEYALFEQQGVFHLPLQVFWHAQGNTFQFYRGSHIVFQGTLHTYLEYKFILSLAFRPFTPMDVD